METKISLHLLHENDIGQIVSSFQNIGWNKQRSIYEAYLLEQTNGARSVVIAKKNETFCGYVTVKWQSDYPFFREKNIPEISDLNVLPKYQKQGIGTKLIATCEQMVKERGYSQIGLGVGMTKDYGNAQQLYIQLGYVPDGHGLHYKNAPVVYGNNVTVDDDLIIYLYKDFL